MNSKDFKRTTLRPEELIKSTVKLSGATLLARVLGVIRGYVTALFLGPHTFGIFSIIGMVNTYASFIHLGLTNAARRELPFFIGRNDTEGAQEVRNNAFTIHILTAILVAGGIWLSSYWFDDKVIRWAIRITAVTIFLGRIRNLYSLLAYIYGKFGTVARCNALAAIISFVFIVCTIYWLKIFSVIFVLLIAELWTIYYFKRSMSLDFHFSVNGHEVWRLAKIGVWLVLSTVSVVVFNLTDRTMVASLLGVKAVGYYALAFFFFSTLHQFVGTGVNVIQPQLYKRLGEVESVSEIKSYIIQPSLLAAYISSFMAGAIWLLCPWFIEKFLSEYVLAVKSTQILVASLFFVAVSKMPQQLLPAPRINRYRQMVGVYFIGVIINAGLNLLFIKVLGRGIAGAAWATLIASTFICVSLFMLAHKFYWRSDSEAILFYIELIIPFIWMVALITATNLFCRGNSADPLVAFTRVIIYLIGFSPCLWYFNRRTGLIFLFITVLSTLVRGKRVQDLA